MTYNSNKFNVFLPIALAVCVVGGVFLGSRLNQAPGSYENGVPFGHYHNYNPNKVIFSRRSGRELVKLSVDIKKLLKHIV